MSTPDEPVPTGAFALLGLSPPLCRAVEVLGYAQPTPIQTESLPSIVAGRDVLAQARTGTGKTLALAVGLLMRLEPHRPQIQGVVVCPARELAEQVGNAVRRLARFMPNVKLSTLCGGVALRSQVPSLTPPPHLIVGTPGRLVDHLGRGTLDFTQVRVLVLDEADRMLDMGFSEPIAQIVGHTPSTRQTLLFSATYPPTIQSLSRGLQRSPVEVTVEDAPRAADLEQVFFEVEGSPAERSEAVRGLLLQYRPESALVFCATREDTRALADKLSSFGFPALALSGELEQREREEVLVRFSNGSATVLVATDVAARGLDVDALGAVIAYELPRDPDVHLHRIGRTGRAGRPGLALNLCGPKERGRAEAIAERHGHTLRWSTVAPTSAGTVAPALAPMKTLVVEAGRQDKLRASDLLGALCGEVGLKGDEVGRIEVGARRTYVAVRRARASEALAGLKSGKVKGRSFRVWALP